MKKICQSVTYPWLYWLQGSLALSRVISSPPPPSSPSPLLFPSVSPFFLSLEHMRFSSRNLNRSSRGIDPPPHTHTQHGYNCNLDQVYGRVSALRRAGKVSARYIVAVWRHWRKFLLFVSFRSFIWMLTAGEMTCKETRKPPWEPRTGGLIGSRPERSTALSPGPDPIKPPVRI